MIKPTKRKAGMIVAAISMALLSSCNKYEKIEISPETAAAEIAETKSAIQIETETKVPETKIGTETETTENKVAKTTAVETTEAGKAKTAETQATETKTAETKVKETKTPEIETNRENSDIISKSVSWNASWKYAEFSKINSGSAILYKPVNSNGITIAVNAGHGTKGGSSVKTQCHPDGSPKVTGGSTQAGSVTATAVSAGTTFTDGTAEAVVNLKVAKLLKEKLLDKGYNVLMLRENDDVQLDNIARTVLANNNANCHIAIHFDSTESDKGAFYMSVPSTASYREMEPVASNWKEHNALGECLVQGLKENGVKIYSGGAMEMDLTQTSYSTIPSVDIELGDRKTDYSESSLNKLADGLVAGIELYFK